MLNAGYDVRLASGAITAGGTLGILIPPSVMLIVYAAVAGQSIVKLYAAAMLPGFFLTFLYLVYILGWAIINPKIAPKLPPDQYRVAVPEWLRRLERGRFAERRPRAHRGRASGRASCVAPGRRTGAPVGYGVIVKNLLALLVPVALTVGTFGATWWYVVIYNAPAAVASAPPVAPAAARRGRRRRRRHARRAGRTGRGEAPGARSRGDRGGGDRAGAARRGAARGDDVARGPDRGLDGGQDPRALLRVVLGAGRRSPRSCSSSTSGAWTASSSRS